MKHIRYINLKRKNICTKARFDIVKWFKRRICAPLGLLICAVLRWWVIRKDLEIAFTFKSIAELLKLSFLFLLKILAFTESQYICRFMFFFNVYKLLVELHWGVICCLRKLTAYCLSFNEIKSLRKLGCQSACLMSKMWRWDEWVYFMSLSCLPFFS